MSGVRNLAAGVVCAGFYGTAVTEQLRAFLRDVPLAGVVLFGGNIGSVAEVRALTDELRSILPQPIVAIDQEGGRVARIREGVEEIPSALAIAAACAGAGNDEFAREAGRQVAFDLRRVGANVDFAPVADLALTRMNTVIGTRAFGDDPHRVAQLAGAFAAGLESGGVAATFKHFPGHGSTSVDSHLELPVIDDDEAALRSRDLIPFAQLLPAARAVMTAHIVARAFDGGRPATVSRRILTDLLRDELHFKGVCFTDCLQMDAIAKGIGSERAGVEALAAGADCVLVSHDLELAARTIDGIARAAENGELPLERLEEAASRVLRLRSCLQPPLPLEASAPFPGIGTRIGLGAVTVIRGKIEADADAAAVSFESPTTEGAQGAHDRHPALSDYADARQIRAPLDPRAEDAGRVLAEIDGRRPIVLMRRAHVYAGQKTAVERILAAHPDALLVSLREPFDAFEFPQARDVACTYGDDAPSIAGLAAVLFEGKPAAGIFPLNGAALARG
ncbi:MAG TPA: beta-N-acetylhexosaminidase [Candidatus Rubrimentiphilum sp.]|nr:beta-N-acetylhexosaminidase [Candidatus Rubrimentiphilum sp.]